MNYPKGNLKFLIFYIITGLIWGLSEFFIGTMMKSMIPGSITGSFLTGFSLFFLTLAFNLERKKISILFVLMITVIIKAFSILFIGLPLLHPFFINPVLSMVLTSLLYLITRFEIKFPVVKNNLNGLFKHGFSGALIASLSAIIFPLISYVFCFSVCYKDGTTIPLSVWYLPVTAVTGAIANITGLYFCINLKRSVN